MFHSVCSHTVFTRTSNVFNVSSVSAVAQQILWNCLIEDPALVLRHFLEKLTVSNRQVGEQLENKHSLRCDESESAVAFFHLHLLYCVHSLCCQDELMYMLRKLLLNIGDLPAQTSHILFNYLVRQQVKLSSDLISSLLLNLTICFSVSLLNLPLLGGTDHVFRADSLRVGNGRHLGYAHLPVGGGRLRGGALLQGPQADHEEGAVRGQTAGHCVHAR